MQDGNALHFDGDLGKGAEIRHSKVKTDKVSGDEVDEPE